jgi:hypothetical protein
MDIRYKILYLNNVQYLSRTLTDTLFEMKLNSINGLDDWVQVKEEHYYNKDETINDEENIESDINDIANEIYEYERYNEYGNDYRSFGNGDLLIITYNFDNYYFIGENDKLRKLKI